MPPASSQPQLRRPTGLDRMRSSLTHYQTFPTAPPKSSGRHDTTSEDGEGHAPAPLPFKQLGVLAVIALAEQTAFNSITPYMPEMATTFPEVNPEQVGLYIGVIGSSFALAQFVTSFFWGRLSDHIGRKPVIMLGTLLTAGCFFFFGFCRTLWQAVLVHVLMGLFNGNAVIVSACLGEMTNKSNQSRAFTYLPVIYGIGGITGPALGGLLVKEGAKFPYFLPNFVATIFLLVDFVVTAFFLEETLEGLKDMPSLSQRLVEYAKRLGSLVSRIIPRFHRRSDDNEDSDDEGQHLLSAEMYATNADEVNYKDILNRETILLLGTYTIYHLSNIAFNNLYPVFASSEPPAGRELSPQEIGLSLAFAGVVAIIFQMAIYGTLKEKLGNRASYRLGIFGFVVSMLIMPFVGYKDSRPLFGIGSGKLWLWMEMGFVLLIKTVSSVGGLTSALLLITNSAPDPSVLGTLNGLAQTLSAAGRAVSPFLAGSLFSLSTRIRPKGEALAWGIFAGIAFLGFAASLGIRNPALESDGWDEEEDETAVED